MKTLIIYKSIHHRNTEKIAKTLALVLHTNLMELDQAKVSELPKYDLIGFGSGIYHWQHHQGLLNFIDKLSLQKNKKAFIFSTSGIKRIKFFTNVHGLLKKKLNGRGFKVIAEFNCLGWDSYPLFTKPFGGINKDRPNQKDLEKAKIFAQSLV